MAEADAEAVAIQLSRDFFKTGSYELASGAYEVRELDRPLPASITGEHDRYSFEAGFAGLAVQSVGYEKGKDDETAVHVYLLKGSASAVARRLPKKIGPVPIKVDRMGPLAVKMDASGKSTNLGQTFVRDGRICCGSSCAPAGENYAGTFGAIIKKRGRNNRLFALSNNHVFAACNHTPVNHPIISPATMDVRAGATSITQFCLHAEIVELRSGEPNLVSPCAADTAIALISDPDAVSSWQGNDTNGFDTPRVTREPEFGMIVKKFGRTTGLTRGIVEAYINTPTPIPYAARPFKSRVYFKNVWTVKGLGEPFAMPGDSGSLVVLDDDSASVGIVFAAHAEWGWIIPISCIAGSFGGIEFVSRHGV